MQSLCRARRQKALLSRCDRKTCLRCSSHVSIYLILVTFLLTTGALAQSVGAVVIPWPVIRWPERRPDGIASKSRPIDEKYLGRPASAASRMMIGKRAV